NISSVQSVLIIMNTSASVSTADPVAARPPTIRRRPPSRFVQTVGGLLALLHLYIGLRLLPDLPLTSAGRTAGARVLCLSFALMLTGVMGRFMRGLIAERLTVLGSVAIGFFSSLFVLTLLRDVVLALSALLLPAGVFASAVVTSAIAVPILAALGTT